MKTTPSRPTDSLLLLFLVLACPALPCLADEQDDTWNTLWLPYFVGAEEPLPTYGTSVAIDAEGGIHAAYAVYAGSDSGRRPAVYAYCPGDCSTPSNWTHVRLGETVQDVRIALDPEGHPRLLLFGPKPDPETQFRVQYQYAACDSGCDTPAGWTLTTLATPIEAVATREENSNRYFAISREGRAGFIYTDTTNNGHPGTFFVSCASGCTDSANWIETPLTTQFLLDKPSLAFAPDGRPILAFGLSTADGLSLGYAEATGDGTHPDEWRSLGIIPIHGSTVFSLQSDTLGRPRLAVASGSYAAAPFESHQLYYLWCEGDCAGDLGNWFYHAVGDGLASGSASLALDAQNHPHIAYLDSGGLQYARCSDGCESDTPSWKRQRVESSASLTAAAEVLPITRCSVSTWITGQRTWLALDAAGRPCMGYDAQHLWTGTQLDPPYGSCYREDVTLARIALALPRRPPVLAIHRVGNAVDVTFENGVLETASDPSGPWSVLVGARSPWRVPTLAGQAYFRVR